MTEQESKPRIRALSLMSGGLDSSLAVCVLRDQGIEVHGITFESPFFGSARACAAAEQLNVPLHVASFTNDIVSILRKPKHGFGSCMNPCIDCHAAMLKRAGQLMEERRFSFISTGEVLNQRPMSQTRRALALVAQESGYAGFILRPLSATLLPETEPERRNWVDRRRLCGIEGRSRKPQFELASRLKLTDYPGSAGGCLLTEPNFAARLRDLRDHEGLNGVRSIQLLRTGRHFRLAEDVKLVVGRNESDNAVIEDAAELHDLVLKPEDVPGPTGLLPDTASEDQIRLAAAICARYGDGLPQKPVAIRIRSSRQVRRMEVLSTSRETAENLRIQ